MKVAIITASIGNGHNAAAYAIIESLQQQEIVNEVRVFDILDDSIVYQFVTNFYLEVITKTPQLYSKIYHWSQDKESSNKIVGHLNFICLKFFKKIKKSFQPDVFIFTHPVPANSYNYSINTPAWTIITDFSYHSFWFNPRITGYFIANNEIKTQLISNNYPSNRIYVTGLPVKKSFTNRVIELNQGLSNTVKPLILVMGGGLGLGPLEEIISELDTIDSPFEALVLTGNNHELYNKIKSSLGNSSKRWDALSFTNNIPELMQRAHILVTKAGGITLAEALVSELPTIIYKPLPGQEEENAQLASSQGWASWAKNPQELVISIRSLLEDRNYYNLFKNQVQKHSPHNSAREIVNTILTSTAIPLRRSL